ncbi:MAG: hypothetical protein HC794_07980, partial [Nitrospiraceae bacterium]|nr:hypothetical protein [Nitrospiraceae bacterium]
LEQVSDAVHAAERFSRARAIGHERLDTDQWTVPGGYNAHRPLVAVDMEGGARLYVSTRTGEVVQDTTRWERGWNWVGAVVHWVYPTVLRSRPEAWHWVVIVLSGWALLTALIGVVIFWLCFVIIDKLTSEGDSYELYESMNSGLSWSIREISSEMPTIRRRLVANEPDGGDAYAVPAVRFEAMYEPVQPSSE